MAIAAFTIGDLFAPLHAVAGSFARRKARSRSAAAPQKPRPAYAAPAIAAVPAPCPLRPLRVVRVLESTQPRAAAGRMVISGRLADVCAELDRLAEAEAARG